MRRLLLLLPAIGLLEVWVFLRVAQEIGLGPAFLLLLAVSLGGALLTRSQGARAWRNFSRAVDAGRRPGPEVLHGLFLLVAGALLTVPGFVMSVVGLLLLLPPVQALIGRRIAARYTAGRHTAPRGDARRGVRGGDGPPKGRPVGSAWNAGAGGVPGSDDVIDVEVVSVERTDPESDDGPDSEQGT